MTNNNIWIVVCVALVVAVVASLITANITGNTIRLNADKNGVYNVYTKMEIDSRLSNLTTNQRILNILNRCIVERSSSIYDATPNLNDSCTATCNRISKTCTGANVMVINMLNSTRINYASEVLASCSNTINYWLSRQTSGDVVTGLDCLCC